MSLKFVRPRNMQNNELFGNYSFLNKMDVKFNVLWVRGTAL